MKEVAHEMGLPYNQVRDVIINGQSGFTKYIMESNTFHGIRWPYLGLFKAKIKKVQMAKYMKGATGLNKKIFTRQVKRGKVFEQRFAERETDKVLFDEVITSNKRLRG